MKLARDLLRQRALIPLLSCTQTNACVVPHCAPAPRSPGSRLYHAACDPFLGSVTPWDFAPAHRGPRTLGRGPGRHDPGQSTLAWTNRVSLLDHAATHKGLRQTSGYATSTASIPLPPGLADKLQDLLGDRFTQAPAQLESHGRDESYHDCIAPAGVAFPVSTKEVSQIMKACGRARTPVIPYGTGTSLEGHIAALHGGVCMDMSRMNNILEVNVEDMDCRVEAGVTRTALNEAIRDSGLFFSVDPGADASIGGMAATRASGTNTVRYGSMRDNVIGMTAVLADGSIARLGGRARKSSAGYDLTRLLVGSEGTLGVITEIALRLYPQPEAVSAAVCTFESMKGAVDTVVSVMQCGVPVARIELLDELTLEAVNRYSHTSFRVAPTLFFEFHGSPSGVSEQAQLVGEVAADHGGSSFEWHSAAEERSRMWGARHTAYWASIAMRAGCRGYPTDVCVPVSHLATCVLSAQKLCKENNLIAPLVGHVGDGNFHMMLIVNPEDAEEVGRAVLCVRQMVYLALEHGGTCTGEHGIGYGKLEFLPREHGREPLLMMAAIKRALDPFNILNPGKLGSNPQDIEDRIPDSAAA